MKKVTRHTFRKDIIIKGKCNIAIITSELTFQTVFLNRGKYEVNYCLYTNQESYHFHDTIS